MTTARKPAKPPKRRAKGEGSVFHRAYDGQWVARVAVPNPGGPTIFRTAYGTTQAEALAERDKMRQQLAKGVLPSSATVAEWLDHWLTHIAPDALKDTTVDRHRSYAETFIKPYIGKVRLQDLQPDHVRKMLRQLVAYRSPRAPDGLAPRSILKAKMVLQAALTVAEKEGRVVRNVARVADLPKMADRPAGRAHAALTPTQAQAVLDKCTDTRNRARLAVALMCGLRQGEALGLLWSSVRLAEDGLSGYLDIYQAAERVTGKGVVIGTPKNDRSFRRVELAPAVAIMLAAWRVESGAVGYVFGHPADSRTGRHDSGDPMRPIDPRRDYKMWTLALKAAGVPHVPLHGARGTAGSLMLTNALPHVVAEQLGHSPTVLMNHYAHATPEQRAAMLEPLAAIAAGKPQHAEGKQ